MEKLEEYFNKGDDEDNCLNTYFKIHCIIGHGAFGKVVKATCLGTQEEVAIKVNSYKF